MKTLLIVLAFVLIGICVGRKPIKCEVCGADDASSDGVGLMLCDKCHAKGKK